MEIKRKALQYLRGIRDFRSYQAHFACLFGALLDATPIDNFLTEKAGINSNHDCLHFIVVHDQLPQGHFSDIAATDRSRRCQQNFIADSGAIFDPLA